MRRFSLQIFLVFIILPLSACGGIQLTDIPKTMATLNLSNAQQEINHPKMAHIRDIVEDYNFEKSELTAAYRRYRSQVSANRLSRYEGGGRSRVIYREGASVRAQARGFLQQRQRFLKEIDSIVDEIRASLTPEQLVAFEKIKLPELELPDILKKRPNEDFLFLPGSRFGVLDEL